MKQIKINVSDELFDSFKRAGNKCNITFSRGDVDNIVFEDGAVECDGIFEAWGECESWGSIRDVIGECDRVFQERNNK